MGSNSVAAGNEQEFVVVPRCLNRKVSQLVNFSLEIGSRYPRVAYLSLLYADQIIREEDPKLFLAQGVQQFKTWLSQKLDKPKDPHFEDDPMTAISKVHKEYHRRYMKASESKEADGNEIWKTHRGCTLLSLVQDGLNELHKGDELSSRGASEQDARNRGASEQDARNRAMEEAFSTFNILPLHSQNTAVMKIPEVLVAYEALKAWPDQIKDKRGSEDILGWLGVTFGFQRDNIRNMRENLILLLTNIQTRLVPTGEVGNVREVPTGEVENVREVPTGREVVKLQDCTVDTLMDKLLDNYRAWCKFLGCNPNILHESQEDQKWKILYMSLYLLIWGEAANLRFMPECLCYIFHCMAAEVHSILEGQEITVDGGTMPSYNDTNKSFIKKVITPIYQVIQKESTKSKNGKESHSKWCNYDDLNEFFWSAACLSLDWHKLVDGEFFKSIQHFGQGKRRCEKSFFVETRSFLHIFRSFHRVWLFHIITLQALVIIAWGDIPLFEILQPDMLYKLSSIFITTTFLSLIQGLLDLILNFPGHHGWKSTHVFKNILKFIFILVWSMMLLISYLHEDMAKFLFGPLKDVLPFFEKMKGNNLLCLTLVAIHTIANLLAAVPLFRRWNKNLYWLTFLWWSQPRIYVGRRMHESHFAFIMYGLFWVMLLCCKLSFSYFVEIKPLINPTKELMDIGGVQYVGHEFFPNARVTYGAIITLWLPVLLVYFLDVFIWYAIFSSLCGYMIGAFDHLGEIRTTMLRSTFQSLPRAFNKCLLPSGIPKERKDKAFARSDEVEPFAQVWNEVIHSFREEDLINNREMDLLLFPRFSIPGDRVRRWPSFLLARKIPIALDMTTTFQSNDADLWEQICADDPMKCAVIECYDSCKLILKGLMHGKNEQRVIKNIFEKVEGDISQGNFLENFKVAYLPRLVNKFIYLVKLLKDANPAKVDSVVSTLQDLFDILVKDVMNNCTGELELPSNSGGQLFGKASIVYPLKVFETLIHRLYLIFNAIEHDNDIPANLEARRRISFFANSLFMNMPLPPEVHHMRSFSVMTPYYNEDVIYSNSELKRDNEDGISTIYYLKTIFPDEWNNFLERRNCNESEVWNTEENILNLRHWASFRGQTLSRTVRGMMYHRKALMLQAFLDPSNETNISEGYRALTVGHVKANIEALVDTKFTCVITCQNYGSQKKSGDPCATDILNLMVANPSLRVAYIDEAEERENRKLLQKVYYSVLVRAVDNHEQEIYRIKLPGPPILGEGKAENQNHAIIFTRGEALQTIDMNQDNSLEEAYKMRNVLQEFNKEHDGRPPTILGLREHIFTASVSSLAWFMSNQETTFVTLFLRVLARLFKVRFHYGHPDIFDRIFHMTRGGVSKGSRVINLSEDIFAGFTSILRGGKVTHHEYIQVGKGRDVGMNQICLFEAKVASGNGEQAISRDIYRLGRGFDFFRALSFFYTTIGSYVCSASVVLSVYAFLYGKLYLSLSGIEKFVIKISRSRDVDVLGAALSPQSPVQLGLSMILPMVVETGPMVVETGLERGFLAAVGDMIVMQLQMASVFFTFSQGTKFHYFTRTILHGGAKYRGTGRGFVVRHVKYAENYRMYSRSHFTKALEMFLLLFVYWIYGSAATDNVSFIFWTSPIWYLVFSWLFAPFLFNPLGFEWYKIVEDWDDWVKWMNNDDGIRGPANRSWESWWEEEQEHLQHTGFLGRILEIILSLRFFILHYGIVCNLDIARGDKRIIVYGVSWVIFAAGLFVLKIMLARRTNFSSDYILKLRIFKICMFIGIIGIFGFMFNSTGLTISDIFVSLFALLLKGWAVLQICQACRPLVMALGWWEVVRDVARAYEYIMGAAILVPVGIAAWFSFVSEIQTRLLFNQAFSRGLHIQQILNGGREQR